MARLNQRKTKARPALVLSSLLCATGDRRVLAYYAWAWRQTSQHREASGTSSTSSLGSFEMKLGLCELTSSFLLILQLCPDNKKPIFPCRYWSCNSCATVLSGHPVAKPASRLFLSGQVYDTDYSDRWRDSFGLSTTLSLDQSASSELRYGSFLDWLESNLSR